MLAAADEERNKTIVARMKLEEALSAATVQSRGAQKDRRSKCQSAGLKTIRQVLMTMRSTALNRALQAWIFSMLQQRCREHVASSLSRESTATQSAGFRLVMEALNRFRRGALHISLSNWRVNQLDAEGRIAEAQKAMLGRQLDAVKDSEVEKDHNIRLLKEENTRLQQQLKEAAVQKQILIMEVENLKAVGEQLVSELVVTASELTTEFEALSPRPTHIHM